MSLINTPCMRERIVVARKRRRCESMAGHLIEPGDRYLLCTEYPGGEAGYADTAGHPVRLYVCQACAPTKFETDGDPIAGEGADDPKGLWQ